MILDIARLTVTYTKRILMRIHSVDALRRKAGFMPVRKRGAPTSLLKSGSTELPVAVAGDWGNAIAKVALVTPRGRYPTTTYPHAVKMIDESDFRELELRSDVRRNGVGDTFCYERQYTDQDGQRQSFTRFYSVGETASSFGFQSRRSGSLKYELDYYGPYAIRGLMDLFPNGHGNIHLLAMFPPGDIAYVPQLKAALGGSHIVTNPRGVKAKYVIRSVRVVDEPVGGLMHKIIAPDGEYYNDHSVTGKKVLVIDIGGQVSSMTPATSDGEVNYRASKSFGMGINDVEKAFEAELRRSFPEFRRLRLMPQDQIREAIMTGYWQGGGREPIDCREAKVRACGQLLNDIQNSYENELGGNLSYNHILVTGGGGALLYDMLNTPELLNHGSVMLADIHSDEMHLANVRGAAKMFVATLKADEKWRAIWATS